MSKIDINGRKFLKKIIKKIKKKKVFLLKEKMVMSLKMVGSLSLQHWVLSLKYKMVNGRPFINSRVISVALAAGPVL